MVSLTHGKRDCFVIMSFDGSMNFLFDDVFSPVVKENGFNPVRIDRHGTGGSIAQNILNYIQQSALIITDLTGERPNCYFELGYAMGKRKDHEIIICCRKDHDLHYGHRNEQSPKIHFDLAGYQTLFWTSDKIEDLKVNLGVEIKKRKSLIPAPEEVKDWKKSINSGFPVAKVERKTPSTLKDLLIKLKEEAEK